MDSHLGNLSSIPAGTYMSHQWLSKGNRPKTVQMFQELLPAHVPQKPSKGRVQLIKKHRPFNSQSITHVNDKSRKHPESANFHQK